MRLVQISMSGLAILAVAAAAPGSARAPGRMAATYSDSDFAHVRKVDAHVHANRDAPEFARIARQDGFDLLSINVEYPDFPPIATQAQIAARMHRTDPDHFNFATTFSMDGFGAPGWTAQAQRTIDAGFAQGAVAVKVWKNIGMIAKDSAGKRVFLDDPRFDPIMAHIQARKVPLIAHQAEPKNCWLPLDQMSTENDRSYFVEHPEYYMYRHPEEPGYERLMAVRDRFVGRHPHLAFDGAHMASLEWSVDALARFLDRYPQAVVDLAARMSQVQVQSNANRKKVRAFFIRYQDRLMYGTDLTDGPPDPREPTANASQNGGFSAEADAFWRSDWHYLATAGSQRIASINADTPGLALPRAVIDKIYFANAHRFFKLR